MMTDDEAKELRAGDYVTVLHDEVPNRPRRVTQISIGVSSVRVRVESIGRGGSSMPWLPPAAVTRAPQGKQWDVRQCAWVDATPGTRGIYYQPAHSTGTLERTVSR